VAFGEATGEKVVSVAIHLFSAEGAWWGRWWVKNGESEFSSNQNAVDVRGEAVVLETPREGVKRDAGGWGQEQGEDIEGFFGELRAEGEEGLGLEVVV